MTPLRAVTLAMSMGLAGLVAAITVLSATGGGPVTLAALAVSAGGLVVLYALLLGRVCWVAADKAVHPPPCEDMPGLEDYPALQAAAQLVSFSVPEDGRRVGWFIPGQSGGTILLLHGYGCRRQQMLDHADVLNRAGYSVFLFDFRSSGDSDGDAVTLGFYEQRDAVAAVEYLKTRPDVDAERLGSLGISMGAVAAILAAAKTPEIKATIADSPYESASKVVKEAFTAVTGLPTFPCAPVAVQIIRWRLGISPDGVVPKDDIPAISPRAVLLIHGLEDKFLSPGNSETLLAAAREPKELWLVEGSQHVNGINDHREEYCRRMVEFFDRHLKLRSFDGSL